MKVRRPSGLGSELCSKGQALDGLKHCQGTLGTWGGGKEASAEVGVPVLEAPQLPEDQSMNGAAAEPVREARRQVRTQGASANGHLVHFLSVRGLGGGRANSRVQGRELRA